MGNSSSQEGFDNALQNASGFATVGAEFIPFGSMMFGSKAAGNQQAMLGSVTGTLGKMFSGPNVLVLAGGAVVLLMVLK